MKFRLYRGDQECNFNRPAIMGILNITPDSFSDGGLFLSRENALKQAQAMLDAGADIIDIGGESTRPGAEAVSVDQELSRVIPIIEALRAETDAILSIDTSKAAVMREAVKAGADMINDVCALRQEHALSTAAELNKPVCLMHMQGEPRSMQKNPQYNDVVGDIMLFLQLRAQAAIDAGLSRDRIFLDPGFGFGKTVQQNLQLVQQLHQFKSLHFPLLVGISRKSTIGAILDKGVDERLIGSVVLATLLVQNGADIIRVHDVDATMDVLKILQAIEQAL